MSTPALKIAMTLLVRNEDDIIEDTILYHHLLGVDVFIVMDNLSTDRTRDILAHLAREIPIECMLQPEDNYAQSEWVTSMARKAYHDHGADWVINGDADEFWLLSEGHALKSLLAAVPMSTCALTAARFNAVLLQRQDPFSGVSSHPRFSTSFERRSTNALGQPLPPKCLHRASASVIVHQGNHSIEGIVGSTDHCQDLFIFHYPYRSFNRYQSKIALGGNAYSKNTQLPGYIGRAWREQFKLLSGDGLRSFWTDLHVSENQLALSTLMQDTFEERTVVERLGEARLWWRARLLQQACERLRGTTYTAVQSFKDRILERVQKTPPPQLHSDPFYQGLHFAIRGSQRHYREICNLGTNLTLEKLPRSLDSFRDIFSLFPANRSFFDFLSSILLLLQPEELNALRQDLAKECVFLHISCRQRFDWARQAVETFPPGSDRHSNIVVVGDDGLRRPAEIPLAFGYQKGILSLPVADSYEALATKVFYAMLIIHLVGSPNYVVKLDDDIALASLRSFEDYLAVLVACDASYAGRPVGFREHRQQLHGWHIGKCQDQTLHSRGYQYPLPPRYAAGGHGYVLGKRGTEACAYMFMAMKSFFGMSSVELEDVYVGHAMVASGIALESKGLQMPSYTLPGLCKLNAVA